jgi:D-sedoheptulose 7-phosphate isomerase
MTVYVWSVGGIAGSIPLWRFGAREAIIKIMPDVLPDCSAGVRGYVSDYLQTLAELLAAVDTAALEKIADVLYDCWERDARLVLCGNGGSASTSSHLVCDFQKNVFLEAGKPFEVVALTDSPALLLAWGNDTSFENVFAGQARTWLRRGDVLIAISGSGNSPNVLEAVKVADEVGAITIGFCGYAGGKLAQAVQHPLVVRRDNMQQVEDLHMIFGHILYSALRDRIHGRLK